MDKIETDLTSNRSSLLEETKTEASSCSPEALIKLPSFSYTFPSSPQILNKTHLDHEIDSNFKLYKYVIWAYCLINVLQIVINSHSLLRGFHMERAVNMAIYVISFAIWFYGNHGLFLRSPICHFRFQGLLIVFMLYHVVICTEIILDSYTVIPNMTFTMFGLNAIYGIFIPVLVYYRADELRAFLEANTQKSIV